MIGLDFFLFSFLFVAFFFSTVSDIRFREVWDYLNFSLIAGALGVRVMWAVYTQTWTSMIEGVLGFGVAFLISVLLFYTGQWGGGDAKLLMGVGAALGFDYTLQNLTFAYFLGLLLLSGTLYGIVYAIVLSIKKRELFAPAYKALFEKYKKLRYGILIIVVLSVIAILVSNNQYYTYTLIPFIAFIFMTFHFWIYIKAIETSCMFKDVAPDKLTEGDWVAHDINVGGKLICSSKDLGLEKEQIEELKKLYRAKKIKSVTVKEGMPFVPPFFIAYLLLIVLLTL